MYFPVASYFFSKFWYICTHTYINICKYVCIYLCVYMCVIFLVLIMHSSHSFGRDAHFGDNRKLGIRNFYFFLLLHYYRNSDCCFRPSLLIDQFLPSAFIPAILISLNRLWNVGFTEAVLYLILTDTAHKKSEHATHILNCFSYISFSNVTQTSSILLSF